MQKLAEVHVERVWRLGMISLCLLEVMVSRQCRVAFAVLALLKVSL